jgi:hypothetical protein
MIVLFCADPLQSRQPDEAYHPEVEAASALGIEYAIVNYETLVNDRDAVKAVRQVSYSSSRRFGVYRGWMLRPDAYALLYDALQMKNIQLINDAAAYIHCHYLPESYSIIERFTPKSVWLQTSDEFSMDEVMHCLRPFGSQPVVVKDFVKSQKHYWAEACFIPSASERKTVERVVRRFIEWQGEDLNVGLVFREFVEFEPLGIHSKSGMPLAKEFRVFVLDGEVLQVVQYWEEGEYRGDVPSLGLFEGVVRDVRSRFYTMDIAKRKDGEWMIVELGDAQVAGLPETADAHEFYRAIAARLSTWS